jgi:hypothetical protein
MPVTKQTYAINAGFTGASVVTALRSALIDAGLMTEWHDSFSQSGNRNFRVLRIQHDAAKAYGTNFYVFVCDDSGISVSMATGGWKETGTAPINIPTGVQYLDWHTLPVDTTANANSQQATYSITLPPQTFICTDLRLDWMQSKAGLFLASHRL